MEKFVVLYATIDTGPSIQIVEAKSAQGAVKKNYIPPPEIDREWWDKFVDESGRHELEMIDYTGRTHSALSFWYRGDPDRWAAAVRIQDDEEVTLFSSSYYDFKKDEWKITIVIFDEMCQTATAVIKKGKVIVESGTPACECGIELENEE